MYQQAALATVATTSPSTAQEGFSSLAVHSLADEHEAEVLAFLATRPIHTVNMVGLIRDNGLVSPLNRGAFYACSNDEGRLEGVALIGHATLVEARTDRAMEALARKAQECTRTHFIMGEQERVEEFWNYYSKEGQQVRLACRELLFELRWPVEAREDVPGLRLATLDDLELVMPVQAQMAQDESGVNPLEKDPTGFRMRCARRIEQRRTWVLIEGGQLIFKAEVVADTSQVAYLEGIYVSIEERRKGYGLRCLSQLCRTLLWRAPSVCILVNERNTEAQTFYRKAGFKFQCLYDTIFLHQQ